jgi:hypothetical protein
MSVADELQHADLIAWCREHEVCWEIAPVLERVKGRGVDQTGYALKLFAPLGVGPGDTEPVARPIFERLRRLALEALHALPVPSLLQVEPAGRAVVSPGSPLVVELQLTLVASPPHPGNPLPAAEVRRLIAVLETRLRSMGLRKRG